MNLIIKSWEITWGNPVKSNVLIYQKGGSDDIKKMVLKDISATVYGTDMKLIYLSKEILYLYYKKIFFLDWRKMLLDKIKIVKLSSIY